MSIEVTAAPLATESKEQVTSVDEVDLEDPLTWKCFDTGLALYDRVGVLGEGADGRVFRCINAPLAMQGEFSQTAGGEPEYVAVKIVERPQFEKEGATADDAIDFMSSEDMAYSSESGDLMPVSPSFVNSYSGMVVESLHTYHVFFMECMDGTLADFVCSSWDEVEALFRGVLGALDLLDTLGYVHADIKAENVMFTRGSRLLPDKTVTKPRLAFALGDFGRLFSVDGEERYANDPEGRASIPEGEHLSANALHKKDVYDAGVVLQQAMRRTTLAGTDRRQLLFLRIVDFMTREYSRRWRGNALVKILDPEKEDQPTLEENNEEESGEGPTKKRRTSEE